jgi:hypothetical protein
MVSLMFAMQVDADCKECSTMSEKQHRHPDEACLGNNEAGILAQFHPLEYICKRSKRT